MKPYQMLEFFYLKLIRLLKLRSETSTVLKYSLICKKYLQILFKKQSKTKQRMNEKPTLKIICHWENVRFDSKYIEKYWSATSNGPKSDKKYFIKKNKLLGRKILIPWF